MSLCTYFRRPSSYCDFAFSVFSSNMDVAFFLAKAVLTPLSKELMQVLVDVRDFNENSKLVEDGCKRLECLRVDIESCFDPTGTTMPRHLTKWINDVQKALENAKQLANNSREPQQRARYCNDLLLSKPNLSREMRKWKDEFQGLLGVLDEDLCRIKRLRQISSWPSVQSENTACGEELQLKEFTQHYKSVEWDDNPQLETNNMVELYSLYTEISYRLKPKRVAIAYVLYDKSCREILKSTMMVRADETTHHQGYYHAIIQGLRAARSYGVDKIDVYTKGKLVYNQMQGNSKVKDKNLRSLHSVAELAVHEFTAFTMHDNGAEGLYVEAKQLCSDLLIQYLLPAQQRI